MTSTHSDLAVRLYKKMLLIRRFEEKIADIYHTDVIKSPVHLSIGQEAVAVGVCEALEDKDFVSNTYRCHATHIAKGGDLNAMMAELYGKVTGCAGGKAGSMHLVEINKGILGASAVVGTTIPVAAGYAWALKQNKNNQVLVAFFGDGATEEGCFAETINFAALHKLPMIFLCENNKLAIHNPVKNRWPTPRICERVATYGIETHKIDSGDVFDVYNTTKKSVDKIRTKDQGPIFIECATYRYKEHVGPGEDLNEQYRDRSEYAWWKQNDQIDKLARGLDPEVVQAVEAEVKKAIQASIDFAESSPFPVTEKLYEYVYAA
jgi:TPP-dependent pyruvate/acetoin dehydrogenase alpha subunit